MFTTMAGHLWERLPNGYDVELIHGIPLRISDNGRAPDVPRDALQQEVSALSHLQVVLDAWHPGELPGEHEARIVVSYADFAEVLRRLAMASAALFVERYHRAVNSDEDIDWDLLEYRNDYHKALAICGMRRGEVNMDACFAEYVRALHLETQRLVESHESPCVLPE